MTSFLARYATVPLDIAVVFLRERQLRRREQPDLTTGDVARSLVREYRSLAATRRQRGRDLVREIDHGGGALPVGAH